MKIWTLLAFAIVAAAQDNVTTLIRGAVEQQQAGNYAAAADGYRAALKLQPKDVATHVNLGVVLAQLGRFDDAIAEYNAADQLLPGDPRIQLNLALAYRKSGRVSEAQRRFAALHAQVPQDEKVTMLLADCELELGDADGVVDLLAPIEAKDSNNLAIAYMLGMAYIQRHDPQHGQALLDRILRQGDSAEARFLLGTSMFESGDYPAAVKQLASAIELNRSLPRLQSLYGRALMNTGDPDAAINAFRTELETNPNDYAANLGFGQILTVRKRYNEARAHLQRALLAQPNSGEAEVTLSQCFIGMGLPADALPYAQAAVKALPKSAQAHQTLASVYRALHRPVDAVKEENLARRLAPVVAGPKQNDMAPDFALTQTASGKTIALRELRAMSPVVLVFGSYSCPNFRASVGTLKELAAKYGDRLNFVLIYIREAHATGDWQSGRNVREDVSLKPATTFEEKSARAVMCTRKLSLPFPALVDGMDGATEKAYAAWPSRLFVIAKDGRVLYGTALTEQEFHPADLESVLKHAR